MVPKVVLLAYGALIVSPFEPSQSPHDWRFGGRSDHQFAASASLTGAQPQAAPQGVASGLVNTSTSRTRLSPLLKTGSSLADIVPRVAPGSFAIDPAASRIKRLRTGIITWSRVSNEWARRNRVRKLRTFWPCMLTLTYAVGDTWEPKSISRLLKTLSNWLARRGLRVPYVWSAELQKRGVIHYHIVLWLPRWGSQNRLLHPYTTKDGKQAWGLPKPDDHGWWKYGSTRVEWARNVGAMGPYLAKYISKGAENAHELPQGARIFGKGGLPLQSPERAEARFWALPSWLRTKVGQGGQWCGLIDIPRRLRGGGWLWRGERFRSPWFVSWRNGVLFLSPRTSQFNSLAYYVARAVFGLSATGQTHEA